MSNRTHRIVVMIVIGFVQRTSTTLGTLLIFPQVLHAIGLKSFGLWGTAASLALIINFADLGLGSTIITFVSRALASGKVIQARRVFGASFTAALAVGFLLLALSPGILVLISSRVEAQIFAMVLAGIAINIPLGIANPTWLALQRGWMVAFWDFVQTAAFVVGLYICSLYSSDVRIFVAAIYFSIVIANFFNILWLLGTRPEIRPLRIPESWPEVKILIPTSAKYLSLTMLDALSYILDTAIALQVLGALAAAQMTIVQRMAVAAIGVILALSQYLWPAYVEASVRGDMRWIKRSLIVSILVIALFSLTLFVGLAWFGPALCRLWLGQDVGFQASTFGYLALWIFLLGTARALATVLNALDVLTFQFKVFALFIAISLALKFILPQFFGIDGILISAILAAGFVLIPLLAGKTYAVLKSPIPS